MDLVIAYGYKHHDINETEKSTFKIVKKNDSYILYVHDAVMMTLGLHCCGVVDLLPQFIIATGHCVVTGLGLGILINLLLSKENVTKITVVEKNQELINYMRHQYESIDTIEFICTDAYTYQGTCDTLLIDHYNDPWTFYPHLVTMLQNIQCKQVWFWGLERFIYDLHQITKRSYEDIYTVFCKRHFQLPPYIGELPFIISYMVSNNYYPSS